jgi:PAS domain S-box-containing protein
MLQEIIHNPNLNKYRISFNVGETLFHEGDLSQDLYILVSGHLDIYKGKKKIAEVTETGSFFGEMSFLLGEKRTATVRATQPVQTIRIPREEITTFLHEFPDIMGEITKSLAERLDETSQTLYRLKEFCDQLPDAVIATDRAGKIITWNAAAEALYGREWNQMKSRSMEEIFDDPRTYKKFFEEVKIKNAVREKILKVRHPQKGALFVSTSTTLLHDDNHHLLGFLSLGRDVTAVQGLKKKVRRSYYRLFLSAVITVLLALTIFLGHPHMKKDSESIRMMQGKLENEIYQDYQLLEAKLIPHLLDEDVIMVKKILRDLFNQPGASEKPYFGLVLLDSKKTVLTSCVLDEGVFLGRVDGSAYHGISFQGDEGSSHRILVLYRTDPDHPMGKKSLEIAFRLYADTRDLGWLIFQMDPDQLIKQYGIDESDVRAFRFKHSEM